MNYRGRLALSSTPLIQAASAFPVRSEAALYRSRRSLESLNSYRSVSPLSMGGRPLGRFGDSCMVRIMPVQIFLDKVYVQELNARTLIRRLQ
jgi:hypothetical protein